MQIYSFTLNLLGTNLVFVTSAASQTPKVKSSSWDHGSFVCDFLVWKVGSCMYAVCGKAKSMNHVVVTRMLIGKLLYYKWCFCLLFLLFFSIVFLQIGTSGWTRWRTCYLRGSRTEPSATYHWVVSFLLMFFIYYYYYFWGGGGGRVRKGSWGTSPLNLKYLMGKIVMFQHLENGLNPVGLQDPGVLIKHKLYWFI